MNEINQSLALAHAAKEFPREACGLLVIQKGREVYCPCRNIGVGTDQFVIHPEDYVAAYRQGEIVGVFHSHPNLPPEPSQADRVACEATGLPWSIVSFPAGQWAQIKPVGYVAPLVGRQWAHGVLDCYALVRDWYAQERGIELPDFERFDDLHQDRITHFQTRPIRRVWGYGSDGSDESESGGCALDASRCLCAQPCGGVSG